MILTLFNKSTFAGALKAIILNNFDRIRPFHQMQAVGPWLSSTVVETPGGVEDALSARHSVGSRSGDVNFDSVGSTMTMNGMS